MHDAVGKVHFAIFRTIDMTVGIGQTGKSLAEVRLRVTELLREGFRLVFQVAPGNPAGGGKRRLDGRAGFLIQFGVQGQSHAFFQRQRIADDRSGELEQALVPQVNQGIHDAGNQGLRLVGKDGIGPVRRGHEGNKKLRQGFRRAERERVVGVGKAAGRLALDLAACAVVQHAKIIITPQKTRHLPYLHRQLGRGVGGDVEQPAGRCQRVVGQGNERFRFAGAGRSEKQAMGQNILGLEPQFPLVLKPVAEKEDALRSGKTASSGQGIAFVRTGQAHRHTERQAFLVDTGATRKEQCDTGQKQRRRQNGEEEQTHPRAEHSTDLHLAELERVRETLRGGAYITVQAFTFLCFVVFQTSDLSVHMCNL